MSKHSLIKWLTITFMIVITLSFYNNCGKQFVGEEFGETSTLSSTLITAPPTSKTFNDADVDMSGLNIGDTCDKELKLLFANGYHKFARKTCNRCHYDGPGKGRFADDSLENAFNDFMPVGYNKFSSNATTTTHNPPETGPQNTQEIGILKNDWLKGLEDYNKCKTSIGATATETPIALKDLLSYETTQKLVPNLEFGASAIMEWDFNNDFILTKTDGSLILPKSPGAKFSVKIGKHKTSGGETYYAFSSPRIYGASNDLHIKTMQVKINGRLMVYATSFRYIDAGIYAGSLQTASESLLSTGALITPGVINSADKISFAFEKIEIVNLPPPAPPIEVNFTKSSVTRVDSNTGKIDITLSLSQSPTSSVTISLSVDDGPICTTQGTASSINVKTCNPKLATALCPSGTCSDSIYDLTRARSIVSADGTGNRFDWDYKFTNLSLTFLPGQTSRTISIEFSTDVRYELLNRVLTIRIDPTLIRAVSGPVNQMDFVIMKSTNPKPVAGIPTFSSLMNKRFGVLGQNCLECHNSVNFAGGYDMTNYDLMRQKNVIIPYQLESKMYYRMNPNSPNYIQADPMPRQRILDSNERSLVEKWILNGAKND